MINALGLITDTYTYDAFGNITAKAGETYNPYLYNQEQYDANTGLYYLRNRYMDPSTGRFVSMDSYAGNIYDPVSLHKYLYANGNPVMYIDPTGYFSLKELAVTMLIGGIIGSQVSFLATGITSGLMTAEILSENEDLSNWDIIKTSIIVGFKNGENAQFEGFVFGAGFAGLGVIGAGCGGVALTARICTTVTSGTLTAMGGYSAYDLYSQGYEVTGTWVGLLTSFAAIGTTKSALNIKNGGACFTEGTLVATGDGYKPIEEIEVGDYVWSENPVTGEIDLKKVVQTFVRCKDEVILIYVGNEVIETTREHPFYVEGKGWIAAGKFEVGDKLKLLNGEAISVGKIEVVELGGKINVYNFEVEDFHTYFVGESKLLVHNSYDVGKSGTASKGVTDGAPEPEVQNFIEKFKQRYPGREYKSGHKLQHSDDRNNIEIDFETDNAILEFKRGNGKGLTRQIVDRQDPMVNPNKKTVIGVPGSKMSRFVQQNVENAGGLMSNDINFILELIKPD